MNDFFQTSIWLIIVNETRKILENQDLIQITILRNPILNRLLSRIKAIIVIILILTLVSSFIISSLIFEIGSFVIFGVGVFILYKRFKVEQSITESKLVKLRWGYYCTAWFLAVIFVFVSAIGNGLILIFYSNEINGVYFSIFQLLNNIIPLGISLNFYWFVFIPERGRRSYSLVNPKKFLD
ncbi:MAG: hypothetical protein HeimC2_39860 [Candidatus Heimdallarchaeota archaeon LC_2]|nr:MAG: hypothetical protein HeimC2_39860 [Candidatus Heimdallarchaeota archaeon LC_2]